MRQLAAAVATAALLAALLAAGAAAQVVPDDGGRTPVARAGSERADHSAISRGSLRRRLRSSLRSVGGASGAWVYDASAPSRKSLFGSAASKRRIPASNQKLFTTAAFVDRFGGDKLVTRVFERGDRGPGGRTLNGNLVLVGDGDPALATASFAARSNLPLTPLPQLARDVRRSGLRRVKGRLRVDDTIFDGRRGVAATGWSAGPYLSPLSGLSFNSGYDGRGYASDPAALAGRRLKEALRKRGVRVKGRVAHANVGPALLAREPVGAVRSPSAGSLIAETNKPSNNFFAEMLLKRLGATPTKRGTTPRGAARVERFARRVALGVEAHDGSGLGRNNRASPRQVGRLLVEMGANSAFRTSLAVAGREGTLAGRMRGTAAEGRCRGKTGTLSGVSALSGYCRAGHGRVAFSILMNGVDVNRARVAQDRMAAAIARYRR